MLTSPMGLSVSTTYAHSVDGIFQNRVRRLQISWPLQTEDAPELTLDSSSAPGTPVTGAGIECRCSIRINRASQIDAKPEA